MTAAVISTRGLWFNRGRRTILAGVDLDVQSGEVVALLGPNGAGKSTLLRLLLGLLSADGGTIELCGRPLASLRRREVARLLAYVPQHHTASFPYTVTQIVGLGKFAASGLLSLPKAPDEAGITTILQRLRISHLASRDYTAVSGGERQLTLIARALYQGARILMMDEPDAGLDYGNQRRLLDLMRELSREGYTIIFTTHHPDHALYAASRSVLLDESVVVADGPPETVLTSELIEKVYGIAVRQVEAGRHRVFAPA